MAQGDTRMYSKKALFWSPTLEGKPFKMIGKSPPEWKSDIQYINIFMESLDNNNNT